MSENSTEGAPAGTDATQQTASAPPWGSDEDFKPDKAWNLIENLRKEKEALAKREALTPEAKKKLAEYERLEQASQTELERQQQETNRWQSESEKWRTQAVSARIAALASDFADPEDAATALASSDYLGVDGVINEAQIKADLAALLDKKPHWRRPDGTPAPTTRAPAPNGAQGTSGTRSAATPGEEFGALLAAKMRGA